MIGPARTVNLSVSYAYQKEERVRAHIVICFWGYVPWTALAQGMRRGGLGDAPRTLLEEFAKIKE